MQNLWIHIGITFSVISITFLALTLSFAAGFYAGIKDERKQNKDVNIVATRAYLYIKNSTEENLQQLTSSIRKWLN